MTRKFKGKRVQDELIAATSEIRAERYPRSDVVFLAGSLVRGEGTATSDLDLVVVFKRLPKAYRESFQFRQWPVEAFVHDPETLRYFFLQADRSSGVSSLPSMVADGIEVPAVTALSKSLKALANSVLAEGPPSWSTDEVDRSRYTATTLVDDLRDPRSTEESVASGTALYGVLVNHYLRSRGLWSGKNKMIPRRLIEVDPEFARRVVYAFRALFEARETVAVIELAEAVLAPDGGLLFDGYRAAAPEEWRET